MRKEIKESVCLVHDNADEIRRFKENLSDYFTIGAGTSISEALSDLQKQGYNKPDLFILDLYFPEGPKNTEEELMEMEKAREVLLNQQTDFLFVLAQIRQSSQVGLELAKDLHERWGSIPFIFFTRKGTLEDSNRAFRHGALKVIKKPDPNKTEKEGRPLSAAYDIAFKNNVNKIAYEIKDAIRISSWWWRNKRAVIGFLIGLISSIIGSLIFGLLF